MINPLTVALDWLWVRLVDRLVPLDHLGEHWTDDGCL